MNSCTSPRIVACAIKCNFSAHSTRIKMLEVKRAEANHYLYLNKTFRVLRRNGKRFAQAES